MLHIHRADRADRLADALAGLLAVPLEDPFASEIVSVPTRGMERWLTQRMSAVLGARAGHADGICAGVVFPSPHQLVTDAVAAASGVDPEQDPWLPERSAWRLLETVEDCIHEPWLATLASYLGRDSEHADPVRAVRRLSAVRHLATLFDRYALHRPPMVQAWAAGDDTDATGHPLPTAAVWQAELWRRLRTRIGTPGPAERRQRACARLREDPALAELPDRLALFGLTRLPAGHFQVLQALSADREIHLCLLHPSAQLWTAVASELATTPVPSLRRADDPTAELPHNQLLASWGRDARELQVVLGALESDSGPGETEQDAKAPATLLGRIQDDIRNNRPAPGAPLPDQPDTRLVLDPDDTSVQIHSCHGRARQVEVIRDAVLHALAEDETLEPRDVIVMCPDVETFAPLIQATFGAGELMEDELSQTVPEELRPIDLRVRLADRSLRQTNPILGVVSQLLNLADERMTATQVLDLADRGPVRRRFRFDDDDLARVQGWIGQAGIRWGLDAERRRPFKLERIEEGTWQAGLQRLLLGVTMTDDGLRLFDDVLPLDDVDSGAIDLAGRFTEFIARLRDGTDQLAQAKSLAAWAEAIADAADLLTAASPRDRWQRAELQRILDELVLEAGAEAEAKELAPGEIRACLHDRLQGRPTRANFRTGHLTVCTLMPMRSVPHRVVCLLGLDDGSFPRKAPRDGDDLMLDDPHIGERDPRSEDRQLLLDALMAATERVIVTYTGNDERTNTPRPPAVPVGELLDAVEATARCDTSDAREQVLISHPLQPFDPRNFEVGTLIRGSTWSFDPVTLGGARALNGPRQPPPPFLSRPLPSREDRVIELDDLVRFVEHPIRAFLRQRLGISLWGGADEIQDGLPVELDGLERWGVGQRLLQARLAGVEGNTAIKAEIARGTLPPGFLGKPVIDSVYPIVDAIVESSNAAVTAAPDPDPVDVRVALADGRVLTGTIAGVRDDVLLTTTYSRVSPRQRLAAWVRLVAMTASAPEREFSAATVGRGSGKDDVRTARVGPLAETTDERRLCAEAELGILIDLYDRGMRAPLPIFPETSAAYAAAAHSGLDPSAPAEKEWVTDWQFDREDRRLEHQLALGGVRPFSELLSEAPSPDESGEGWDESETSRLGRLSRRLWDRLLGNENLDAR